MNKKSKNFIIPLVIYPFDVMVSIGESNVDFVKAITKHLPSSCLEDLKDDDIFNLPDTCQGRCTHLLRCGQTIIRMPKPIKTCEQYGSLAHEIFHAVEFLMDKLRMPLNQHNDEAYAYLIGFLTKEVYKRL